MDGCRQHLVNQAAALHRRHHGRDQASPINCGVLVRPPAMLAARLAARARLVGSACTLRSKEDRFTQSQGGAPSAETEAPHRQRCIESEPVAQRGNILRGCCRTQHDRRRISWDDMSDHEHDWSRPRNITTTMPGDPSQQVSRHVPRSDEVSGVQFGVPERWPDTRVVAVHLLAGAERCIASADFLPSARRYRTAPEACARAECASPCHSRSRMPPAPQRACPAYPTSPDSLG